MSRFFQRVLFSIAILLFFNTSFSQKPVVISNDAVVTLVTNELDEIFQSAVFLNKKNKKFNEITGSMTIDIGVNESGKVATFYKVASDISNIDFINFMSNFILEHKFHFKLPKNERHKIRYSITF